MGTGSVDFLILSGAIVNLWYWVEEKSSGIGVTFRFYQEEVASSTSKKSARNSMTNWALIVAANM